MIWGWKRAGDQKGERIGARASDRWAMNGRLRASDVGLGVVGWSDGRCGGWGGRIEGGDYAATGRGGRSSLYSIYFGNNRIGA